MDVLSNDRRWLVTLVTSNKVVAPVLQDIVKQGMDKLYVTLENHLKGLAPPCSQQTLTYADVCRLAATPNLASSLKDLNFGNINNNSGVHGKSKGVYNYHVSSPVDLAKLYLPHYLAVFSAFDKSMDLSAALRLLGCRKYPIQIFVSSDPLHDIQSLADDVRENVRNRGSHFNESDWTQIVFDQCFDKLKALLQSLPLLPDKKKELLDELSAWKTEGFKRIVDDDIKDLLEKFQNVKLASINDKLDDMPTKDENERVIKKLFSFQTIMLNRLDMMESLIREVNRKLDGISVSALNQESSKSVQSAESSVLSTDATSAGTRKMREKDQNPESTCKLRAKIAKLSRRTLHKAAINGRCDLVKILLESGEDVNQMDEFDLTPLHLAAWYGQRAVVELLLQHGANVNAVDRFQKTALQKAERNNHQSIVGLLLRNNASPSYNQPASLASLSRKAFLHVDARSGFNRLQATIIQGDHETFWKTPVYLDNFAKDMNLQKTGSQAKVFPGKTASEILLALQDKGEGNVEVEKMYKEIFEKIDTLTELHLCKNNNDEEKAVEIVLNEGVDINIPGKSNRTPLLWASVTSSGEFMQTLIDLGADVNAQRTDDKVAPLFLAACFNNYMAVDILLKHGANAGLLSSSETMGLHECVDKGFLNVSRLLIDSGCDINLRNNEGQTPLYLAVKNKHKCIVKCLLESKAEVNMKYGEDVRVYLVRGRDREKLAWHYVLVEKALLPLFLRRTNGGSLDVADFGLVLTSGWGQDPPENVRKSVREMCGTFPDTQSQTVLHVASKSASLEIVDLLVKYKADINAFDADSFTPLHLAAMHGNIQVVKKLVELNADVNLKVDGKDAADLAHINKETEIEEFLKPKRSLPQRDSEGQLAEYQLVESQTLESHLEESQPAGGQSVLKVAIKGAGQGLKYLEHGLKFLEENLS